MEVPGKTKQLRYYAAGGTPWYRDHDGDIKVQEALFTADPTGGKDLLSLASRVAIALSIGCSQLGRGKVIVLHPGPRLSVGAAVRWRLPETVLARVPSLFYMDYIWTSTEQDAWMEMDPLDQLNQIDSCHLGVPPKTPVLPFDVQLDTEPRSKPTLQDFRSGPVTVYITPSPYVGLRSDMLQICRHDLSQQAWICDSGWDSLHPWRVQGGITGVVEQLRTFYVLEDFSHVCRFDFLRERHVMAYAEIAELKRTSGKS